ncbi:Heterokaryon incompatibility protein (HET) domain containing protein [Rhypophila decipiens]
MPHKRSRSTPARLWSSPPEGPYQYRPLPDERSIRLLRIFALSERKRTIFAELDTVQLGEDGAPVEYLALSYTWGPSLYLEYTSEGAASRPCWRMTIVIRPQPRAQDDIDGLYLGPWSTHRPTLTSMPLSQSLSDFFTSFGSVTERPFWIDAISINQSDPDEISAQVELMADIYRLATGVVVWLGAEDDEVPALKWLVSSALPALKRKRAEICGDETLEYSRMTHLGLSTVARRWSSWAEARHPCDDSTWAELLGPSGDLPELAILDIWRSYFHLFDSRRWFRRAWTFQEAGLGRGVVMAIGGSLFYLNDLLALDILIENAQWHYRLARENPWTYTPRGQFWATQRLLMHRHRVAINFDPLTNETFALQFIQLLEMIYPREATFVADKYFSVVGVGRYLLRRFPTSMRNLLRADVRMSATEVYTSCSRMLVENGGKEGLRILEYAGRNPSPELLPNLPTWVADWSGKTPETPGTIADNARFNVHGSYDHSVPSSVRDSTLLVEGVLYSTIEEQFDPGQAYSLMYIGAILKLTAEHISAGHNLLSTLEEVATMRPCHHAGLADGHVDHTTGRWISPHRPSQPPPSSAPCPHGASEAFLRCMTFLMRKEFPHEILERLVQVSTPSHAPDEATGWLTMAASWPLSCGVEKCFSLTANRTGTKMTAASQITNHLLHLKHLASLPPQDPAVLEAEDQSNLDFDVWHAILDGAKRRSIFVTASNTLCNGYGVDYVQPGDEVWFLAHYRFPVVLRPITTVSASAHGGASKQYMFRGPCYVHGVMQGQYAETMQRKGFVRIEIV